nr:hypothetical protein asmbl_27 [uncultured bacterium]
MTGATGRLTRLVAGFTTAAFTAGMFLGQSMAEVVQPVRLAVVGHQMG